jgi:predicted O-methyltransferase YrrM
MEHFYEKIDGWSSMGDQGNLIKNILNHVNSDKINIAEIGVYKGRATAIFNVELINRNIDYNYYAIDHFLGSEEHDNTVDYYSIALENLNPIIDKINLIKNDSINESEKYPDNYFDIVYIDASHDYESVKKDIIAWLPKVKDGGIICGDDYISGWPGVVKAVNEVIGDVQVIGHQQWFKVKGE